MATNMREKFRKYWGDLEKMNKMIFISSVLDPRKKLEYVPFVIVDMFGKEIGDNGYGNFQRREIMRTKQQFEKHKEISGGSSSKSELGKYLVEEIEPDSKKFDILGWWKVNELRFPILAEMAHDVLAFLFPLSSLTPKLVQSLICLQDWLRRKPIPINVEEDLEYLEKLEIEMTCSVTESSIVDV
ncbi:hypothetical protein P3L10_015154 [Capsicum annuum]